MNRICQKDLGHSADATILCGLTRSRDKIRPAYCVCKALLSRTNGNSKEDASTSAVDGWIG